MAKILSVSETQELLHRFKNGDKQAKDILIKHNYELIEKIIEGKFKETPYSYELLFSLGLTGLNEAITSYQNQNFYETAVSCIYNKIKNYLTKNPQPALGSKSETFANNVINEFTLSIDERVYPQIKRYIIDQFELSADSRTKEILKLRFGFYGKNLPEDIIARRLNININHILTLVTSYKSLIINRLNKLQSTITDPINPIKLPIITEKEKSPTPKYQTKSSTPKLAVSGSKIKNIFERMPEYTPEQIITYIASLTEKDKNLITRKFGADLTEAHKIDSQSEDRIVCILHLMRSNITRGHFERKLKNKTLNERLPEISQDLLKRIIESYSELDKQLIFKKYGSSLKEYHVLSDEEEQRITTVIKRLKRNIIKYNEGKISLEELTKIRRVTLPQSIYTTFEFFTKDEINYALSLLSEREKELVYAFHNYDLENPLLVTLPSESLIEIKNIIYPKIGRQLRKQRQTSLPLTNQTIDEQIITAIKLGVTETSDYIYKKLFSQFNLTDEEINYIVTQTINEFNSLSKKPKEMVLKLVDRKDEK